MYLLVKPERKMKVFGIGLNKTGTTTLGRALEILGFENHVSVNGRLVKDWKNGDYTNIYKVAEANNNFEDWPWPLVYKEMFENYPDSKFILTIRKTSEIWYKSLCKHAERIGPRKIRKRIYGYYLPQNHKKEHVAFYEKHNREVIDFFAKHAPGKLLVVCFEDGHGWSELCEFLEVDVPEVDFPVLNKATDKSNEVKKHKKAHNTFKHVIYNDNGLLDKIRTMFS